MARARAGLVVTLALAGCGEPPPLACEDEVATAALTVADRKLVGRASPYPADGLLRGRDDELARSQAARRVAAWAAVERAVAPVPFALAPGAPSPHLPRWHTWYGKDDLTRMFDRGFRSLAPAERTARAPLTEAMLDELEAWNPTALDELPTWTPERFAAYAAAVDTAPEVVGVGGIDRVMYSPGAARHVLASYREILACLGQPRPPAIADGATPGPRRVAREAVALAACGRAAWGPYYVGAGESLTAQVDGVGTLRLRRDAPPTADDHDCAGTACAVAGPGPVWVELVGDGEAGAARVTIEYQEADPAWAACLAGPYPLDAAVVKADWRRAELGFTVPRFDTSAASLAAMTASPAPQWTAIGDDDPGADRIYTAVLPNGNRYRLAGLHLMTKELDHWLWVTLWWSPSPDDDFGADRPAALADTIWRNYKMCVVTSFAEGDRDPRGGQPGSLGDALAAVHDGPSWCSNPFLEVGAGNAGSSCVGCHQHGGTGLRSEEILSDPAAFPAHGRVQVRNNFPTDYAFAIDSGDQLGRMLADEVEYWTPR